jgi:hypothetical protein
VSELLAKARQFLHRRPLVAASEAFLLEDSMHKTLQVYQSLLKNPEGGSNA